MEQLSKKTDKEADNQDKEADNQDKEADNQDKEADDNDSDSHLSGASRDDKYKNWLKAAESLVLLQQGLAPFVDREVYNKHAVFLNKVPSRVQGTSSCGCTFKNILPDHDIRTCCLQNCFCKEKSRRRRKCPQNYCSTFLQMILNEHRTGDPLWKNTDINTWTADHWSIAKCFMTTPTTSSSAQMTDTSGLLSVIINGKFFQCIVTSQLGQSGDVFLKARDMRNYVLHRPKMQLTDSELQDILDTCVAVLKDPASLLHDKDACSAVKQLESLRNDQLTVTSTEETKIQYQRIEALKQMIRELFPLHELWFSRFTNERRLAEKVKKKFHNIKQRAKEKIDEVRKSRGKTGGGPPPPQPTPAEEALLKFCGTRPGMTGLNGIDTDADCSKPDDDSLVQVTISSTLTCNTSTATAECTASDAAAGVSKDPDHNACSSSSVSKHVNSHRGKKRKLDAVDEATLENLRLDNDRIRGEIQIQEQKLKTLKSQQSAFDSLQKYFSFKLSSEINVTFQSED